MKSKRLTNQIKEDLASKILSDSFDKEIKDLHDDKKKLADKVYNFQYGPKMRKVMTNLQIESKGNAFDVSDYFCVHFGGRRTVLNMSKLRPQWEDMLESKCKFLATHTFSNQWDNITNALDDTYKRKRKLRNSIFAILNTCTTTKKLLEVWPECEKWLIKITKEPPKGMLPAVLVQDVNNAINAQIRGQRYE